MSGVRLVVKPREVSLTKLAPVRVIHTDLSWGEGGPMGGTQDGGLARYSQRFIKDLNSWCFQGSMLCLTLFH